MSLSHRRPGEVITTVRLLIALAAVSLVVASLIHFGFLIEGYDHRQAAVAEMVIGGAMLLGLAMTWMQSPWGRRAAIGALAFGLLGTLVGVFTIIIGVGPQTAPDVVYHGALVAALIVGLALALRPTSRKSTALG